MTKGMVAGNIVFGGLVGVGIYVATGAAYDYPEVIGVPMTPPERATCRNPGS